MLIIPAIDLKDGHCVRLKQGLMDEATVFSEDPVSQELQAFIVAPRRFVRQTPVRKRPQ